MMNKFKLFLILILSTVLCIPKADAVVNINGSIFTQTPQLSFYDNTNGILTERGAVFNDSYGYYFSNNSILTTGGNTYGANVTFTANEGFVAGYTYSLSILIGTDTNKATPSSSRICTAENIYNANTRYQQGYPCTNAISITSMDGIAGFNYNGSSFYYTILTYVFTPDFTSPTITLTYNTAGRNDSRHYFGGYHLEVLSDNKTGVSASQVQSIINNSGLASANSVQELQTEIENVKQDINNASDAIVDSNKETQDVIKDQFNDCRDSYNLIDKNNLTVGYISLDGSLHTGGNSSYTTNIIPLENGTYTLSGGMMEKICYYNNNQFVSCSVLTKTEYTFTLENYNGVRFQLTTSYIGDLMLNEGSSAKPYEPYGKEICTNRIDETNDQLGNLNDNITSSDTSSSEGQAGSFFEGFETDDYGLSDIVTMPLQLINTLTNNTCVSLKLILPFVNHQFELPCMSSIYQRHFGTFFTLYQTITFGFISYWVIVRIFNLVKDFKNPDHDEIEVLDL